jgi:hypothetical protein
MIPEFSFTKVCYKLKKIDEIQDAGYRHGYLVDRRPYHFGRK